MTRGPRAYRKSPEASWFIVATAILVALVFWKTEVHTNIGDFFFPGTDTDAGFLAGQLQSDEFSRRYLMSVNHPGIADTTATEFISQLFRELDKLDSVNRVWFAQLDDADVERLLASYRRHQIHLFSLAPEQEIPALITPTGLASQARIVKDALLGPDPMRVKSILEHDPMLLTFNWLKAIGEQFNQQGNAAGHTSFFLETQSSGLNTSAQATLQQRFLETFERVNAGFEQDFSFEYTGVPVFAVQIKNQATEDIRRISTLSIATVVLLSLWVFRSWRALFCTALVLTATVSLAILITQLVFDQLHGLTLALGTTLIGICIDYFIHSMVHAGDKTAEQRKQSIRQIWPTLITGGATTLIGYIALSISGFPGLQQIAVFTGTGIITALLLARFVLPGLMDLLGVTITPTINLQWFLEIATLRGFRYSVFFIIAAAAIAGLPAIHWGNDLNMMTPELENLKQKDSEIRSRMASIEPGRFILTEGKTTEQALRASEAVLPVLEKLRAQRDLDAFYPPFPWLASKQLQTSNQLTWNALLTPDIRSQWDAALSSAGLNAAALPRLEKSHAPFLDLDQVKDSPAWPLISRQIIQLPDKTAIVIWLGKHHPDAVIAALLDTPNSHYFSQKERFDQLAVAYRNKAQSMLIVGILVIFAILAIRYRSVWTAIRVLIPAGLSILILLGAWGLAGSPMGLLHLIGLLLTAAVCVDYGIFFLENKSDNEVRTFQAITVSAITTSAAFACLGAAENPALHALAWTVSPGVLAGFLLCPVILRKPGELKATA